MTKAKALEVERDYFATELQRAREALKLQKDAEKAYAKCDDCDGYGDPEQCDKCFPLFKKARSARRVALSRL